MDPNREYVNKDHDDDRYLQDRASRSRVWQALVDMDTYNRHKDKSKQPKPDKPLQPLRILSINRKEESACADFISLCTQSQCNFCGSDITKHAWTSPQHRNNSRKVVQNQPAHCTVMDLMDRLSQDFFPGLEMTVNFGKLGWHYQTYFILEFCELGRDGEVLITTPLKLQKAEPDAEEERHYEYVTRNLRGHKEPKDFTIMRRSMSIQQQLEALNVWLARCNQECDNSSSWLPDYNIGDDYKDDLRERQHTECHPAKQAQPIVAKHVLRLTEADAGFVRVVEAEELTEQYAALSHCWGHPDKHPRMTTRGTLAEHMAGIAITSLPQSFRDAIRICLAIGISYLWIDCLCIVQDDSAEWLEEAEKMADIYSNSYITIAATVAQDSHCGFLRDFAQDLITYEVKAEATWDVAQPERLLKARFQIDHASAARGATPLNERAWCLQEWYLPIRLIEFQLNNLRFLCHGRLRDRLNSSLDQEARTRSILHFGHNDRSFFRSQWDIARRDFLSRQITHNSDRLPALAGLAQMFKRSLRGVEGHNYLAGLWSTRISEDLGWTVLEYDKTATIYNGIPSWSWGSVATIISYIYLKPSRTFVDYVSAHCYGFARPKETLPYLTVRGFITTMYMRVDPLTKGYEGRPYTSFWRKPYTALTTKPDEVEKWHHLLRQANRRKTAGCFVSDVEFGPTAHTHSITAHSAYSTAVPVSYVRRIAGAQQQRCEICLHRGYLTTVKLLLLSRTDACWLALVLAPVAASEVLELSGDEPVYERLGLMEVGYYDDPYVRTPDGYVTAWDTFWQIKQPRTKETMRLI